MSIAMATLVLTLLTAASPAAVVAKRGGRHCSAGCGGFEIPDPFGVGPECSLRGFNLTCATGADNASYLLLGNPSIKMYFFGDWSDYAPFPAIGASIGYFVKMAPGVLNYSVHWKAPGRPFAISSGSSLFVVGCGVTAFLFTGTSDIEVGNCSVLRAGEGDQSIYREPVRTCRYDFGIGCCRINIAAPLRAFTLNIYRTADQSAQLLQPVNAFIADQRYEYSFQSSDLETDLTGNEYPVQLAWAYQPNCKRAMEDRARYACVSNHSRCEEAPVAIGGYVCNCTEGFYGNPYVVNGCVLSTPPPLDSNEGRSSPILEMPDGSVVTSISIDEGTQHVLNLSEPSSFLAHMGPLLYAFSGEWGVVKWAVDNMTCKDAMASNESYRCFSQSDCLDVTDERTLSHVGYRCKCSPGFVGNPYIKDGCTSIISGKIQRESRLVILGVTVGLSSGGGILFLAAVFAVLTRRWKRRVQKRLRRRHFHRNKGILLEQLISSDQSAGDDGTKIFSLEELEKADQQF